MSICYWGSVPDEQIIWRYLDFPKLFSLVERRSIFFCPLYFIQKTEPFEYTSPPTQLQEWRDQLRQELLPLGVSDGAVQRMIDNQTSGSDIYHWAVNCWSINEYESYALWRTFVPAPEGVAIKSSVERLKKAFSSTNRWTCAGNITYVDYDAERFNHKIPTGFTTVYHKARFYDHEREFRLVTYADVDLGPLRVPEVFETETTKRSLYVPVLLEEMIEEVRVSPYASRWFNELATFRCKNTFSNFGDGVNFPGPSEAPSVCSVPKNSRCCALGSGPRAVPLYCSLALLGQ